MLVDLLTAWGPLLTAVGGVIVGVIGALSLARKDKASAGAVEIDSGIRQRAADIEALQAALDRLTKMYCDLSDQYDIDIGELRGSIKVLEKERQTYSNSESAMRRELSEACSKIARLEKRITELEDDNRRKAAEIKKRDDRLALLIEENTRLKQGISGL